MNSQILNSLLNPSGKSSASCLHRHKYNLPSRESLNRDINETHHPLTKEQIEQELLRAFDTQMSFGPKQLPKGLPSKNKQKVRSVSVNSASYRRPQPLKPSIHLNKPAKPVQKPQSRINSSQPTHRSNRSQSSQLSSIKPFHHNKRESVTSAYMIKKQTQKLVQKLITVKPSHEVSRQKHLESYSKHLHSKHIMMHRYENDKKGIILLKKANCCSQHTTVMLKDIHAKKNEELRQKKFNAIEMKEIELRKMLKEQKRKNRLQTLKKIPPHKVSLLGRRSHERVKTMDTKLYGRGLPITSASSQKSTQLPRIRIFSKAQNYQRRGAFATPGSYSSNKSKTSGLINQRHKTIV